MDAKVQNKIEFTKIIFVFLFLTAITIAFYVAHFSQIPRGYKETKGVCVSFEEIDVGSEKDKTVRYDVAYKYRVGDNEYKAYSLSTLTPKVGKTTVSVYYNTDNPGNYVVLKYGNLAAAITITAILLGIIGAVIYLWILEKIRQKKQQTQEFTERAMLKRSSLSDLELSEERK